MKASQWALLVPNSHQGRAVGHQGLRKNQAGASSPPRGAFGAEVLHLRGRAGCNEAICASPTS